jgi:hypothetical protein
MAKMQRTKGARVEREMVHKLLEISGVEAQRVPLSGAAGGQFSGDIVIDLQRSDKDGKRKDIRLVAEVKARRNGSGFAVLEKWLGDNDLLLLKKDRTNPTVAMPWKTFRKLIKAL